jgi:hypothetical protein
VEQYLVDTNVVSDYFSASFSTAGMIFMDTVIDVIPNLSVITQIELLCWDTNAVIEQKVKEFIDDSNILGMNNDVIASCINPMKL